MTRHQTNTTIVYDQAEYDKHAKVWESSGLSQAKYCELHNLKYSWLVAARGRRVNTVSNKQKEFVQVVPQALTPPTPQPRTCASKITIRFVAGSICELPSDLPLAHLKSIFAALGATL